MLPLIVALLLLTVTIAIVAVAVASARKRKQQAVSQIAATFQNLTHPSSLPGHLLSGVSTHADGTPMSEHDVRAYQGAAAAGFAAMQNSSSGNVVEFTVSGGTLDPALAEQVRQQLDQQGFGKLGELVAEQMRHTTGPNGAANRAAVPQSSSTTYSAGQGTAYSPGKDAFNSTSGNNDPFAQVVNGSDPFGPGSSFGQPASAPFGSGGLFDPPASIPSVSTRAFVAPPPASGLDAASRGSLGVAQFVSESRAVDGSTIWSLERQRVGRAPERVSAPAIPGLSLQPGDRVYVHVDPNDDRFVSLAVDLPSVYRVVASGNENRAEPLVLTPELRANGARATGTVKTAEPLSAIGVGAPGGSWRVTLDAAPERGWPFVAEIVISFSTPERAAAITRIGAQVPLLYDPQHPQTITVDTRSMGFADR